MNLRNKRENKAEVFTSAMNDIMFFLMLFFIIISTLLNPNIIKLNLPSASNAQSIHKKEILLSVNRDLQYFVNNKQIPFANLEQTLSAQKSVNPASIVVVRCDSALAVQHLVNVLEIGTRLDMKMILATRKK